MGLATQSMMPMMGYGARERHDPQWTEREYARGGSRDDLLYSLVVGVVCDHATTRSR